MSRDIELALRKQRLVMRSDTLREAIAADTAPLLPLFTASDKVVDGFHWLKARPGVVAGIAVVAAVLRPKTIFRWGRRGLFAWKAWQTLQSRLRNS